MKKPFINHMRFRLKRCFETKSLKRGVISFAVGFGVFGFFSEQIHFIKSLTDSLPEHYFVQLPKRTPKIGDLTVVNNQFYGGRLIKKIIGQAGDQVSTDTNGDLWVGKQLVGKVYPQTGDGRNLTPTQDQVIPEGQVFLYSPHPKSFDSRYQEVGLVQVNELEGTAIAIA
jgi:conjugal transfer pilin signal peptidase TrbI